MFSGKGGISMARNRGIMSEKLKEEMPKSWECII